jgi:hypothetical protein
MKFKPTKQDMKEHAYSICMLFFIFLFSNCGAQTNHDTDTTSNKLSNENNQIETTEILTIVGVLNPKMRETSGLTIVSNMLITHNDKGRLNELFLLDGQSGQHLHTITVSNAHNNDWEDLAQNDEYLFIGDMGNNEGERRDLSIIMIPKKYISIDNATADSNGKIEFYFTEQNNFAISKHHNFDCEALIYFRNYLYLFTKNRLDSNTDLYRIPCIKGKHAAEHLAVFEAGGRIAGAAISKDEKKIALIGYNKKAVCFLWTFENFKDDQFFNGDKKKYMLGAYSKIGQVEGVTFKDNQSVYISSEEIKDVMPSLYLLKLE